MPANLELTLSDMARVALGTPERGTVSTAVLHSLIDIILKRLDCQNEKVTIGGFESQCIGKILKCAQMSPLPFHAESAVPISQELNKIAHLEQRVARLDQKLDEHFQQIRLCNLFKGGERFQAKFWEQYASACEDLCTTCDEDNKIACSLLQNQDFMKKLMRCIATPIVDRLFEISNKLEAFYQTLKEFLQRSEELFKRLEIIRQCVVEIENLRKQVEEYNIIFIGTMEELQDMLDSKLDKVHMPALKKYIRDRFDDIDVRLNTLETKSTCPRAAGFINTNIKCLSCGNTKIGVNVGPNIVGLLPDAVPDAVPEAGAATPPSCLKPVLCRLVEKEPTLMVRMKNLDLNMISARLNRPSDGKVCKLPEANDTIYGIRNSVYSNMM